MPACCQNQGSFRQWLRLGLLVARDVTDSVSESDGIWHFFGNPKSDGYLKSDHVGFEIANC